MRLQWREDRQCWRGQFEIDKRRFSFQTKTKSEKKAHVEFVKFKAEVEAELERRKRGGKAPLTLDEAADKFWDEVGQFHADSDKTWVDLQRVVAHIGPTKLLDEITDADVTAMVAWRRAQKPKGREKGDALVAPATVNRSTTEVLKKIFTRAKTVWRYTFPQEPNWRAHMLKEPEGLNREMKAEEEEKLDAAMREDYAPWVEFALLSGLRRAETLIKWEHVDWQAGQIVTKGKRRLTVKTDITPEVAAILEPLKGHHAEFVFTYVARRTRGGVVKGKRYPISYEGGKTEWQRLTKRAGMKGFRFHDLRHTYGSRLLRETGSLPLVQKALNHRDITTTARYAHVNQTDLVKGASAVHAARRARVEARKAAATPVEKASPKVSPKRRKARIKP